MSVQIEKKWWESKKLGVVMAVEAMLFTLCLLALRWQPDLGWPLAAFMTANAATMGFLAVLYTGKQADLDRYIRISAMNLGRDVDPEHWLKLGAMRDGKPTDTDTDAQG